MRIAVLVAVLLIGTVRPSSQALASAEAWEKLKQPGHVAIMRHAIAPGVGDPANLKLGDCKTQRNLDETGRAQSRRIGAEAAANGVSFARAFSSEWCRCLETARLVAGKEPETLQSLNSFFGESNRGPEQITRLQRDIAALPTSETILLVTHQVVITGLTGVYPASGEIVVLKRSDDGVLSVAGRIMTR
jgi:broad specificity phosphatase PhoE